MLYCEARPTAHSPQPTAQCACERRLPHLKTRHAGQPRHAVRAMQDAPCTAERRESDEISRDLTSIVGVAR